MKVSGFDPIVAFTASGVLSTVVFHKPTIHLYAFPDLIDL
jgi:hypothetical protein